VGIEHVFESLVDDGDDTSLVRPSNWNDGHKLAGGVSGQVVMRDSSVSTYGHQLSDLPSLNYLFNGSFEIWGAGTSTSPTKWVNTGAGSSVTREASAVKHGLYAANLTRSGADCGLHQTPSDFRGFNPAAWWQGKVVTFGCWVKCNTASRARLSISDGIGGSSSPYHSGGNTYEWLQVTRTINGSATRVRVHCEVDTGNATATFDGACLVTGVRVVDYLPELWQGRKCILEAAAINSTGGGPGANVTTYMTGSTGFNNSESGGSARIAYVLPFNGVARTLTARVSDAPGSGKNFTSTLRKNGSDTALTCAVNGTSSQATDSTHEVECAAGDDWRIKYVTDSGSTAGAVPLVTFEYEEIP